MFGALTWHLTRATGVVAYVLLAVSMVAGLALSSRVHGRRPKRTWVLDVHRMAGALALGFLGVHVASLLMDSFVSFSVADVLVPLVGGWKPVAVGAGIAAMWLLIAVELSSLVRRRLSAQAWRRIHLASFGAFALATAHFVMAGTDAATPLARLVIFGATGVIVALTGFRIWRATLAPPRVGASAGARVSPRESDHEAGAGTVRVAEVHGATVGGDDRSDDRQA